MFYNKAKTASTSQPNQEENLFFQKYKLLQRAKTDNTAAGVAELHEHTCEHVWMPVGTVETHTLIVFHERRLPQCQRLRESHAVKGFFMELSVRKHKSISKTHLFLKMHSFIFEKTIPQMQLT